MRSLTVGGQSGNYKCHILLERGSVTRFLTSISSQIEPIWALINRLNWFFINIRFREDILNYSSTNSTPRRLTLRLVEFFCQYLLYNEFLSKTILDCLSGAQMGSIHEKNININMSPRVSH